MYRLVLSPKAIKQLKKLKKIDTIPIKTALEEIKDFPLVGKPLEKNLTGRFSFKFGSYRIIYKINLKDKVIEILSAGHRSSIYNI